MKHKKNVEFISLPSIKLYSVASSCDAMYCELGNSHR
jgi:hypothetical protein